MKATRGHGIKLLRISCVNDTKESDSVVSMTLRSLAQQDQWHRGVNIIFLICDKYLQKLGPLHKNESWVQISFINKPCQKFRESSSLNWRKKLSLLLCGVIDSAEPDTTESDSVVSIILQRFFLDENLCKVVNIWEKLQHNIGTRYASGFTKNVDCKPTKPLEVLYSGRQKVKHFSLTFTSETRF